jgi:hypothetical protein
VCVVQAGDCHGPDQRLVYDSTEAAKYGPIVELYDAGQASGESARCAGLGNDFVARFYAPDIMRGSGNPLALDLGPPTVLVSANVM